MLEHHRTKQGETILIAQMTDNHLCNMISLVIQKAMALKETAASPPESDAYQKALYGVEDISPERAAEATRHALRQLYPYLSEAYLRNLEQPRTELIELLGRDARIKIHGPLSPAMLFAHTIDDEPRRFG